MTQLNLHLPQQLNLPVSQMKVYTFTETMESLDIRQEFLASQCFFLSCRLKMSFGTNCLPLSSAWTSVWILELPWTSRASDQSWTTRQNSSSSRRFEYYLFFWKKEMHETKMFKGFQCFKHSFSPFFLLCPFQFNAWFNYRQCCWSCSPIAFLPVTNIALVWMTDPAQTL